MKKKLFRTPSCKEGAGGVSSEVSPSRQLPQPPLSKRGLSQNSVLSRTNSLLILFFAIPFFANCVGGSAEYKIARAFIDAYYVMADQKAALPLASDMAREKLNDEIKSLAGVETRSESYRARDIEFKKIKEQATVSETYFLFELTLHFPELSDQKRDVAITVDNQTQKVKFFGEIHDDAP